MKLTKITATGTKSTLEANDTVFAAEVNEVLLAQAVRVYLSNKRQGTSKAKTRSEVARTKQKWFKQKGTGNARHGARSANIFVGGGAAHGPKGLTNWTLKITPVMKKKALISALSAQAEHLIVSEGLIKLSGKTKDAVALLANAVSKEDKVLVILHETSTNIIRGLRNIGQVLVVNAARVNALEIAMADKIIMTSEAVKALEERLSVKELVEVEVKAPKRAKAAKAVKAAPVAKEAKVKAEPKKAVKKVAKKTK